MLNEISFRCVCILAVIALIRFLKNSCEKFKEPKLLLSTYLAGVSQEMLLKSMVVGAFE